MECMSCKRKLKISEVLKLAIDGEYNCQQCDIELAASSQSFNLLLLLTELILIPVTVIFAFIYLNLWASVIGFCVVFLTIKYFFNVASIKKQYESIDDNDRRIDHLN